MTRKLLIILVLCGFWAPWLSAKVVELDESILAKLLAESPHSSISASLANESMSHFQSESFAAQYQALGFLEGGYEVHTGGWQQISPTGKPSPVIRAAMGVRKKLPYGMQLEGSLNQFRQTAVIAGQSSSQFGFIPQLSLKIDLWKNLAGSYDRSQKAQFDLQLKVTQLEAELQKKLLLSQARILFWEIAGIDERKVIVKKMQDSSRTQEKLAKQRQDMSIADSGELALYSSQSAERRARLLSLEFQRSVLVEALTQLIPSLEGKEVVIRPEKLEVIGSKVIACSQAIKNSPKVPFNHSLYHKLIKHLESKFDHEQSINKAILKGELSLTAMYSKTGIEEQYAKTLQDSWDSNRSSRSLLLNFSYPLGTRQKLYDYKQAADIQSFAAQKSDWENKLVAKHSHMVDAFDYLLEAVQTQKMNTKYLKQSLKSVEKKYAQARLDVYQLIGEQDRSLNNDLAMVDTQLQIVKAVLEYLSLFSEFPCEFNSL